MRGFYRYIATILVLTLSACTESPNDGTIGGEGGTTLTLSLEQTRTALGGKVGETYPVYWSEGDKIGVNGVCSTSTTIDAENPA